MFKMMLLRLRNTFLFRVELFHINDFTEVSLVTAAWRYRKHVQNISRNGLVKS